MLNPGKTENEDASLSPAGHNPAETGRAIDDDERNRLIESCIQDAYRLAQYFSKRFDVPYSDLMGIAHKQVMDSAFRYDPKKGKLRPYIMKCVRLRLKDHTMRINRQRQTTLSGDTPRFDDSSETLFDSYADETSPDESEQALKLSRMSKLQDALKRLTLRQRQLINKLFAEELPMTQVSEELGISPRKVKKQRDEIIAILQENMSAAA